MFCGIVWLVVFVVDVVLFSLRVGVGLIVAFLVLLL